MLLFGSVVEADLFYSSSASSFGQSSPSSCNHVIPPDNIKTNTNMHSMMLNTIKQTNRQIDTKRKSKKKQKRKKQNKFHSKLFRFLFLSTMYRIYI